MRVLQLLRTLVLSPIGPMLTNDSMRNLMLYCFQICLDRNLTGRILIGILHSSTMKCWILFLTIE